MNEEIHNLEKRSVKLDKEKCSPEVLFGYSSLLNKNKITVKHIFLLQSIYNYLLVSMVKSKTL